MAENEDENEATSASDELARRRQERTEAGGPGDGGAEGATSLEGMDDEPELFPLGTLDGDPKKTLKNLLKAGLPVEVTASLSSAEVPVNAGLIDPEDSGRVLVSYEVQKAAEVIVKRGKDGKIVGYKIRQTLRPTYVEAIPNAGAQAV